MDQRPGPPRRVSISKLEVFHNHCLRAILGITALQQRTQHITSVQVADRFGMRESLEDIIIERHLRWLQVVMWPERKTISSPQADDVWSFVTASTCSCMVS